MQVVPDTQGRIINPARCNPMEYMFNKWKPQNSTATTFLLTKGGSSPFNKVVCISVGYLEAAGTNVSGRMNQFTNFRSKDVLFSPIRLEWNRLLGFIGAVVKRDSFKISLPSQTINEPDPKHLIMKTYPENTQSCTFLSLTI